MKTSINDHYDQLHKYSSQLANNFDGVKGSDYNLVDADSSIRPDSSTVAERREEGSGSLHEYQKAVHPALKQEVMD